MAGIGAREADGTQLIGSALGGSHQGVSGCGRFHARGRSAPSPCPGSRSGACSSEEISLVSSAKREWGRSPTQPFRASSSSPASWVLVGLHGHRPVHRLEQEHGVTVLELAVAGTRVSDLRRSMEGGGVRPSIQVRMLAPTA